MVRIHKSGTVIQNQKFIPTMSYFRLPKSKSFISQRAQSKSYNFMNFRECISTGAASVQTCGSMGHHFLHLRILRLLVPYAPADFEASSYLQQSRSKLLTHEPVIILICCFSLIPNNFGIKFTILNHCAGCNSHSEIGEYGSPRLPARKK